MKREPKSERGGRGRGRKETLADKPLDFENLRSPANAAPSFLPHPLPALLLAPLFSWSLTLVPRSFLLNRTETLATQAKALLNNCYQNVYMIAYNIQLNLSKWATLGIEIRSYYVEVG